MPLKESLEARLGWKVWLAEHTEREEQRKEALEECSRLIKLLEKEQKKR